MDIVSCRDTKVIFNDYNVKDSVESIRVSSGVSLLDFPHRLRLLCSPEVSVVTLP